MTTFALVVFWSSAASIAFTLAGFPLLLWLRSKLLRREFRRGDGTPSLSVVVACYNEERHIGGRIENLLASDYPADKLEILVASDGSTDRTDDIVREFGRDNVRLVRVARGGKGQALNVAVREARGEVLVFSDANTEFGADALKQLASFFDDPTVGGVAGHQVYLRDGERSLSADGECLHWNLDSWQKRMQSDAGSVTSATGAIYAIRASCYDAVPTNVMDDFYISTGVIARGLRLAFTSDARAYEPVATKDGIEFRRKVRVSTQGLRAVWARRSLLNPLRYGWYSIQVLTHKVLRRLLVFPLLAMALSACSLAPTHPIYLAVVVGTLGLAALAGVAHLLRGTRLGQKKCFTIPHFFFMTQVAMFLAALRTFRGEGLKLWEPERHALASPASESSAAQADSPTVEPTVPPAATESASLEECRT